MGAYLTLSISESNLDKSANTSKVKATLYCHSSSGSYNGSSRSGYIEIDGSKHSFSSSFKSNTTTTLSSYTKTVKHNSSGGGKITIKGYYSTGVSAGNISTSKSYTLKTIDRTYTVTFNANGGSGGPSKQTKTYDKTLTLSSSKPTRSGYTFSKWNTKKDSTGTSYSPGGSYTKNADITLYAIWAEQTVTWTYESAHVDLDYTSKTFKYSDSWYFLNTNLIGNGYKITGWKTDVTWNNKPAGTVFNPGGTSYFNTDTFYSVDWEAYEYQFTCKAYYQVGDNRYGPYNYHYNDRIYNPTLEALGETVPEGKSFAGWGFNAEGSGTLYNTTTNYRFIGAEKADTTTIYYAVFKDIEDLAVGYNELIYYNDTDVETEWVDYYDINYNGEHTVIDIGQLLSREVSGFKFAGYWRINNKPEFPDWEAYGLPNKYLFPYNFNPTFENHYNIEYDLVEKDYVIENITSDIELYPVYKDVSNSKITYVSNYKDYADYDTYKDGDARKAYFEYISGQAGSFEINLLGNYYAVAWKLKIPDDTVQLKTNDLICKIYLDDAIGGDGLFDSFDSNEIFVNTWNDGDTKYAYIIVSNLYLGSEHPIVSESATYTFRLENLKDNVGKDVYINDLHLSPPNIIRDINKAGNVVAFFRGAPESPKYGGSKEFWIDGDLVLSGSIHTSGGGGDGGGPFIVDQLQAKKVFADTTSLSDLTTDEVETIYGKEGDTSEDYIPGQLQVTYDTLNRANADSGEGEEEGNEGTVGGEGEDPSSGYEFFFDENNRLKIEKYLGWLAQATTQFVELYGQIADLEEKIDEGGGSDGAGKRAEEALLGWDDISGGEYVEHIGAGSAIAHALGTIIENILPRLDSLDQQDSSDIIEEIEPIYEDFETGYWYPDSGDTPTPEGNTFEGTITALGSNYVTVSGYDYEEERTREVTFSNIDDDLSGFEVDMDVIVYYEGTLDNPTYIDMDLDEYDPDDDN